MPSVFISRDLADDSVFKRSLSTVGWQVDGESLLVFRLVSLPSFPPCDWLFFYSVRGVEFYLKQRDLPNCKVAAMGRSTATSLKKSGVDVDFTGNGTPPEVAAAFGEIATNLKVGFVQAVNSRRSVELTLQDALTVIPLIVYENTVQTLVSKREVDYYVFTSPMNFQAYQRHFPLSTRHRIVAIGPSTAGAIRQAGLLQVRTADQPSEEAIITCLHAWENEAKSF